MTLHPLVKELLQKSASQPRFHQLSPIEARKLLAAGREALGKGPKLLDVRDIQIPTKNSEPLFARRFLPSNDPTGVIVYLHGGGWVIGDVDDFETYGRALAAETNCLILMPQYRLSPEHKFPSGLEDCEAAIVFTAGLHSGSLPLILMGDSAGANLATVAARRLRNEVKVLLQVLYYPVTDAAFDWPSYVTCGDGYGLTAADMKYFFNCYAPKDKWRLPDVSPLRALDLSMMPDAIIITAEYDVLRDEGKAYAEFLRSKRINVTYRCVKGVIHGFSRMHNFLDVSRDELRKIAGEIRSYCNTERNF